MRDFLLSIGAAAWVLPALLLWPIMAAPLVRWIGRDTVTDAASDGLDARVLTCGVLAVEALLGMVLLGVYDRGAAGWQARIDVPWLPELGASLSLGVDALSLPMVVLITVLMPLTLLGAWNNVRVRTPSFGALLLLLTAGLIGVLVSLDLLLFYLAWELMLIPTYFLIGIWGTGQASRATVRYVLFTLVGSLLMLVAILALWNGGGASSFHLDHLLRVRLTPQTQLYMFGAFFLAFAVKSALVPFHTWLPDAQGSAPTVAAVTLGVKVGIYGILRFAIPLFPAAATHDAVRTTILVLAVIAVLYGALMAMVQEDLKRWIAYASISHLGILMLGVFVLTPLAVQGAALLMINHGITTSALFLLVGMLADRRGSTMMADFGGLARQAPVFSAVLVLAILSTIALPGTNGFVGELLVLLGAFSEQPVLTAIATLGVIAAALYGLRAVQRVLFGAAPSTVPAIADLSWREGVVMGTFAIAMLWLGVAPGPVLRPLDGMARSVVEAAHFGPNAPMGPTSTRTTP